MNHIKKLMKEIIVVLLAIGFVSVGFFTLWAILTVSIVASAFLFFRSRNKWVQQSCLLKY